MPTKDPGTASASAAASSSESPRLRRFRVDVGTIILLVVVVQSLLLLGLSYWGSQRLVGAIGESAHRADHQRVEDKVNAFLARAMLVVEAIAATPSLKADGAQGKTSAELLWVLLQQSPELDSVYAADDLGRMLMVQRYPEAAVRHIRSEGERGTLEVWEFKGLSAGRQSAQERYLTERTELRHTQYDPRTRDWFVHAATSGHAIWTSPYIFSAAQELGVSYAVPAWRQAKEGPRLTVASGDVTLKRLSEFVRLFSRAGYGDSALLGPDRNVLARSDVPGPALHLARPEHGVLGAIHAHLREQPHGSALRKASQQFPLVVDHQRYLVRSSYIPTTGWTLVSWVPEDKLLGGLRRAVLLALMGGVAFLGLVLWLALRLAKRVTAPVEQLSGIARRIGRLELDDLPRVNSHVMELQHLDQALDESARGLQAFRRFVPVDVVRQLLDKGRSLAPSGEPREVTVMFTDVNGFTALAESLPPAVLVEQLTRYFNVASEVIAHHGGTIDKFMGDGMMVLWGAPNDLPDAPLQACRAALALMQALDELNAEWGSQGLQPFDTRIGIHTGTVVAGVLGAQDRLAYTAVGDTVNVASRIEAINRELGTRVLVSETTANALADRLPVRRMHTVELRGRQRPLNVYELLLTRRPGP
ncbi:adenylate/guanylate cyclase domain-containing protein [Xenophilus arseniciresistens]|uniref:Adenylate/guanylate cyclase domain-containing protein n=1 Tax=Xenophilus arseniciresistens TaxID=1283306 RepID=A0AAE3T1H8_9BURK|nr:adenylate/guanylate cyclase domain-containing protein [Xenophilus arseniciresistens]MDA7419239.1 adenylate/guanylate cyclase domain-containing protein [Xenophilus arseniciresistens]